MIGCFSHISFAQTCPPEINWALALGGNQNDYAISVQPTSSGGFIIAGYSNSSDIGLSLGSNDFWVVNLDSAGQKIWEKLLGGTDDDRAFSVQQTTDGGFIVAGSVESRILS
jgi:hypothetical protein